MHAAAGIDHHRVQRSGDVGGAGVLECEDANLDRHAGRRCVQLGDELADAFEFIGRRAHDHAVRGDIRHGLDGLRQTGRRTASAAARLSEQTRDGRGYLPSVGVGQGHHDGLHPRFALGDVECGEHFIDRGEVGRATDDDQLSRVGIGRDGGPRRGRLALRAGLHGGGLPASHEQLGDDRAQVGSLGEFHVEGSPLCDDRRGGQVQALDDLLDDGQHAGGGLYDHGVGPTVGGELDGAGEIDRVLDVGGPSRRPRRRFAAELADHEAAEAQQLSVADIGLGGEDLLEVRNDLTCVG